MVPCERGKGLVMLKFTIRFSVLLLAVSAAFAQQTGRLSGTVVDPVGAVVPNATVNLYLVDGNRPLLRTTTNSAGIYDFSAVRPDSYKLEVVAPSFAKYIEAPVKVEPARQTTLPEIKLTLSS